MRTSFFSLSRIALLYLIIPLFIFLFNWFNFPFNLIFILLAWGFYKIFFYSNDITKVEIDNISKQNKKSSFLQIFLVAAIAALTCYLTGVGGWMPQTTDYEKHNFIFNSLAKNVWPMEFQYTDGTRISFVYYLGYYIVPSLFAVLGNSGVLNIATFIWTALGLTLGLLLFLQYFKLPWWASLLLLGFSGLAIIGNFFTYNLVIYNWWAAPLRCTPILTGFQWSPAYLIPILICAPLILQALEEKKISQALGFCVATFFWNPFATVALASFIIWGFRMEKMKEIFSLENIVLLIGTVLPLLIYYSTRLFPEKMEFLGASPVFWKQYPLFVIFEFMIWFVFIKRQDWGKSTVIILLLLTFIIPFFCLGAAFDWCFRTLMVVQVLLAGFVFSSIINSPKWYKNLFFIMTFGVCLFGVVSNFYLPDINKEEVPNIEREILKTENRNFLNGVDAVNKQYLGSTGTNLLSSLILKKSEKPILLNQSWEEAQIKIEPIEISPYFASNNQNELAIYRFKTRARFWFANHNTTRNIELSFNLESAKYPDKIILGVRNPANDEVRRLDTPYARFKKGEFDYFLKKLPKTDLKYENLPFTVVNSNVIDVDYKTHITLPKGITEIAILSQNVETTKLLKNFNFKIIK